MYFKRDGTSIPTLQKRAPRDRTSAAPQARHEVLCCCADLHLNMVASVSRSSANPQSPQLCLWDFELFTLVGAATARKSRPSALALL